MRHLSLLLLVLLAACNTGAGTVSPGADAAGDTAPHGDSAADVAGADAVDPDGGAPDLTPDTPTQDAATDTVAACDPGAGCFLDPCGENGDCLSGWCVEHMAEGVCTQACQEDCPPGWTCKLLGNSGPDPSYACVSEVSNLCKPCAGTADCKSPGGQEDVCVSYGAEGSFCGGGCEGDDDCPWGFSCAETETVDGIATVQCVADAGVCPCTGKSVTLALWTPCLTASDAGQCAGKRVCTEDGLTDCDAAVAAAELCNGLDDDCDGDVDEPTLDGGDLVNLCDDGNPCTVDTCLGAGGCQHEALDAGECADGDPCTAGDHCAAGVCVGSAIDCDDNDPCTDDACGTLGGCTYTFNAADCDDGNACTVADECGDGVCAGTPVNCDCLADGDCASFEDGDACNGTLFCDTAALPYQCTIAPDSVVSCPALEGDAALCNAALCDPGTGDCLTVPLADGIPCDDGDACTVTETCQGGLCQEGVAVNCNDGSPCTDDGCDPVSGCVHALNDAACEDGDVCTAGDACEDGICKAGSTVDCEDANPCTLDACEPAVGCIHVATAGACDDGNACTEGDHCDGGACVYDGLLACDDGNLCTTDGCHPATGCTFTLNAAPCDDGDLCTTGDHCHLGTCIAGGALPCDDGNPCTDDSCDGLAGCQFAPNDAPCDDGVACTVGDVCGGGWCLPGALDDCDDGNPCTGDSCDPAIGCQHVLVDGGCDDGDACTDGDLCVLGACVSGAPLTCDDGNPCTDDGCDGDLGCVFVPNDAPCDDGDPCTDGDGCAGGACQSGPPTDCDDQNPCTTDSCVGQGGCANAPVLDGTVCGPDLVCLGGVCTSCGQIHGSQSFGYVGAKQTFTVPDCVTEITVTAYGAEGGHGQKGAPGKGGKVTTTITVTPGEILSVFVGAKGGLGSGSTGGSGGYNGGGQGTGYSNTCYTGGGGGGASDLRRGGDALSQRIVVAGGGAGGGGDPATCDASWGGPGGGLTGGNGQPSVQAGIESNGKGGTQSAGGAGGTFNNGNPGSLGQGGAGGAAGGGGGGGYYGGGGGGHGGGGGGSSYTLPGALAVNHAQGDRAGNGQIDISW